jgi:hypothetical protein
VFPDTESLKLDIFFASQYATEKKFDIKEFFLIKTKKLKVTSMV